MKTDTPITDEAWAAWQYAGSGMSVHVGRELERELTAAREELAELKEEYGTWWSQKQIAIDELKEVTEQRDYYKLACDKYSEDEIVNTIQSLIGERDRLAEALEKIAWSNNSKWQKDQANEALESLNQPTEL